MTQPQSTTSDTSSETGSTAPDDAAERAELANMLRSYADAAISVNPLLGLQVSRHVAEGFRRAADLLEVDGA